MTDIIQVVDQPSVIQVVSTDTSVTEIQGATSTIEIVNNGQVIFSGGSPNSIIDARQAVQNFAAGQVAQVTIGGLYDLASAATLNSSGALGIANAAAIAGNAVTIAEGFVTLPDWTAATGAANLSPKATYYLSASTLGNLTTVAPTATGQCVVKIGTAVNSTTLLVEIEKPYLLS